MDSKKRRLKILVGILSGVILICGLIIFGDRIKKTEELTYNEVIEMLVDGKIDHFKVMSATRNVAVVMKDGTEEMAKVPNSSEFISFISQKIEGGSDVKIEVIDALDLSGLVGIIISACCAILMLSIRRQTAGGKFDIGNTKSKVTFNDVAGIEEVQEQIEDIIDYFRAPKKYSTMGAKMPKGILLSGEPGNGKTLLAKAMSGEAGVEFFQVTGSSFEERLVGVGASRVRKLFEEAKCKAPAIIFIDEIDSIAQNRYSNGSYNEQTLNQLLAEMDGFDSNDNIIVIAATNHIEVLDQAILRPGRFDRMVYIPNPDVKARQLILELHARNKKISDEVSIKAIAQKTVGFSGANLANILNEAAIHSVKNGKDNITNEDIEEAIAREIVGLKKKYSVMSPDEKHRTAVHEASHAIVSFIVRPEIQNFSISIVPRGKAGGYNFFDESKIYQSKDDMIKKMQTLYAGRVAEEIILGDVSNGSSNDLENATQVALQMTTKYAMNGSFLVKVGNEIEYNKAFEANAIKDMERLCKEVYETTKTIVMTYKSQIEKLASILEEKEYMNQEEIVDFMSQNFNL